MLNPVIIPTTVNVTGAINATEIITGLRVASRNDVNATWPGLVLDNFSNGPQAEVAINFRRHDSRAIQLGFNLTHGFGDAAISEFNIESTGNLGQVVASPFSLTHGGQARLGGYVAPASYGNNTRVLVAAATATDIALTVRSFNGQSGDLQRWESTDGAALSRIDSRGNLILGNINTAVYSRGPLNTNVPLIFLNAANEIALGTGVDIRWGRPMEPMSTKKQTGWGRMIDTNGQVKYFPVYSD